MNAAMKRFLFWFFSAILAVFLVGCATPPAQNTSTPSLLPAATSPPPATDTATPAASPTKVLSTASVEASPSPTATPAATRASYHLTAKLDYATYQLRVTEQITVSNPSSQELTKLSLVVPPNRQQNVFHLQEISWTEGQTIDKYTLQGIRLDIPIEEAWFPGESRALSLTYQISLPVINSLKGVGPSPFGYSQNDGVLMQINIVDWYPFVPPYREGEGWIIHEPWYYGEYLVYPTADFEVSLQVVNSPQDLVVAASAGDEGTGDEHRYHLEEGRNFVLSISPHYQVLEKEVQGTTVLGYTFPFYEDAGKAAFQATVDALKLYEDIFHPYHQSTLTMVQADFDHGMEYEGLYFLNRSFFNTYNGSPADLLVTIAAHETAHQWWYGMVGNDQALEPWIDESICTYSELLYFEAYHEEAVDWWWANRVNYFQPQGVIDRSIYETTSYLDYRDSTYLRGAQFWADLREAVGDEVLFDFLAAYAENFSGQIATGDDFFTLLREFTGSEGEDVIKTYFEKIP